MLTFSIFICLFSTYSLTALPAFSDDDTESLKKQIEQLNQRVTELESELDNKAQPLPRASSPFQRGFGGGWDPFSEFDRMQEEMDRMFQNPFGRQQSKGSGPSLSQQNRFNEDNFELEEKEDHYVIQFDMTGMNKDKMDIEINDHSITVSGESSSETKETSSNQFFRAQSFQSFHKTIPLPVDADTQNLKSEQKDSLLIIIIPKRGKEAEK